MKSDLFSWSFQTQFIKGPWVTEKDNLCAFLHFPHSLQCLCENCGLFRWAFYIWCSYFICAEKNVGFNNKFRWKCFGVSIYALKWIYEFWGLEKYIYKQNKTRSVLPKDEWVILLLDEADVGFCVFCVWNNSVASQFAQHVVMCGQRTGADCSLDVPLILSGLTGTIFNERVPACARQRTSAPVSYAIWGSTLTCVISFTTIPPKWVLPHPAVVDSEIPNLCRIT